MSLGFKKQALPKHSPHTGTWSKYAFFTSVIGFFLSIQNKTHQVLKRHLKEIGYKYCWIEQSVSF